MQIVAGAYQGQVFRQSSQVSDKLVRELSCQGDLSLKLKKT
jgi:hypothetical protein